eukprot:8552244-Alexandrium_andersonii.AAC.1
MAFGRATSGSEMGADQDHSEPCSYDSQKLDPTLKRHMDGLYPTEMGKHMKLCKVEPKEHLGQ